MISIARPVFGLEEEAAIHRVLLSGQLAQGEHVAAFERRFVEVCHVREAVAVSKGTAALHLALIEHAYQAHAAKIDGQPVGSFGTGCFSFYSTKNITTDEGGIVTTDNPGIAERVRLLHNHGQKERCSHISLGYNLRMKEIQGAIGLVQIEKLEQFTKQRIAHAAFLTKHLDGVVQIPIHGLDIVIFTTNILFVFLRSDRRGKVWKV